MADPGPLDDDRKASRLPLSRESRIAWAVIDCAYFYENDEDPDIEAIFAAYGLKIVDEVGHG